MAIEFKAEKKVDGIIEVKAQVEKKPNGDVVIHVPSYKLVEELKRGYQREELKNGKRNI